MAFHLLITFLCREKKSIKLGTRQGGGTTQLHIMIIDSKNLNMYRTSKQAPMTVVREDSRIHTLIKTNCWKVTSLACMHIHILRDTWTVVGLGYVLRHQQTRKTSHRALAAAADRSIMVGWPADSYLSLSPSMSLPILKPHNQSSITHRDLLSDDEWCETGRIKAAFDFVGKSLSLPSPVAVFVVSVVCLPWPWKVSNRNFILWIKLSTLSFIAFVEIIGGKGREVCIRLLVPWLSLWLWL